MRFRIDKARESDTIPSCRRDMMEVAVAAGAKEVSMAILRSVDGKVFEIPDDKLSQFELPQELVEQISGAMNPDPGPPPPDFEGPENGPHPEDMAGPDDGPPQGGFEGPDEGPPPEEMAGYDEGPPSGDFDAPDEGPPPDDFCGPDDGPPEMACDDGPPDEGPGGPACG